MGNQYNYKRRHSTLFLLRILSDLYTYVKHDFLRRLATICKNVGPVFLLFV